jgi:hypothetical protein
MAVAQGNDVPITDGIVACIEFQLCNESVIEISLLDQRTRTPLRWLRHGGQSQDRASA